MITKQLEHVISKYDKELLNKKEKEELYLDMLDLNASMTLINLNKSKINKSELTKIYNGCDKLAKMINKTDEKYIYMIGLFNSNFANYLDYIKEEEEYKIFKKKMKGSVLNQNRIFILKNIYENTKSHISTIEKETELPISVIQKELEFLIKVKCVRSLIKDYFELTYFGKIYLDTLFDF